MSVDIIGLQEMLANLDALEQKIEAEGQQVIEEIINQTDTDLRQSITSQGMVDTGRYLNSWQATIGDLEATESSDTPYGPFLEHGTMYMRARPHVFPTFEKNRKQLIQKCREIVK